MKIKDADIENGHRCTLKGIAARIVVRLQAWSFHDKRRRMTIPAATPYNDRRKPWI